ncbi:hypothetical protein ACUR5C_13475 [Aliikangiella sp. IMCC44653]
MPTKPAYIPNLIFFIFTCAITLASTPVIAFNAESIAEMQKKLNAEVMEKVFSVEDEKKIKAYIQESLKKQQQPQTKPPKYWRKGYTCADIYQYGWNQYQSCRYHRHYYGRYW